MKADVLHCPMCNARLISFPNTDRAVSLISLDVSRLSLISLDIFAKQNSKRLLVSQVAAAWHICKHKPSVLCMLASAPCA